MPVIRWFVWLSSCNEKFTFYGGRNPQFIDRTETRDFWKEGLIPHVNAMSRKQQKQWRRLYHFSMAKPSSISFNIFDILLKIHSWTFGFKEEENSIILLNLFIRLSFIQLNCGKSVLVDYITLKKWIYNETVSLKPTF